jgi:hypothetical protein
MSVLLTHSNYIRAAICFSRANVLHYNTSTAHSVAASLEFLLRPDAFRTNLNV